MITFFAPASRCFCADVAVGEEARRLDHDVHAELAPRAAPPGSRSARPLISLPATFSEPPETSTSSREPAEHRIVAQQMRHRRDVAEVVERHDLEVSAALERRAEEVAADPAESVDPYACFRHDGDSNYAAVELAAMP